MQLVQISDTHLIAPVTEDARAPERAENLRRCVNDINNLPEKPDAVIHTGDMTQHARRDEYLLARDILSDLKMPFYPTPGNRDFRSELREAFSLDEYAPPDNDFLHYATMVGAGSGMIRLISVDTVHEEGGRPGNLCGRRLATLDVTLGEVPGTPTVLFMHHPPFDVLTSTQPFQFIDREAVENLATVLQKHPQVIRILCGHAHRCYVTDIAGVRASTLPSMATDLRLGDYPEAMAATPVYQIHQYIPGIGFVSETRLVT